MIIPMTSTWNIDESALQFVYIHASGPGGQNVNKVATAVQLRFDLENAQRLSPEHKTRLKKLAGRRMTADGWLVIDARRYRSQEKNRLDALQRLQVLLERSSREPTPRRQTRPTFASRAERLTEKKLRSKKKTGRQKIKIDPE